MATDFPLIANSWTILSPSTFIKAMDKSSFLHHGTGIPMKIKSYWGIEELRHGDVQRIEVTYEEFRYKMKITCDKQNRTRLFWASDFSGLIAKRYNELLDIYKNDQDAIISPEMRFARRDFHNYDVEFVDTVTNIPQGISEQVLNYTYEPQIEGGVIYQFSKRYERNQRLRENAIRIHGLTCKACTFNFEKTYGEWGKGYIEIHHTKPLYINEKELEINPLYDLVPVCSNCHTMIHRKRAKVLSIEEIQKLIKRNNL